MGRSWYDGLAPVDAVVRCSGADHRVRWHRGRVVLLDHDLATERVLAALGGAPAPCVDVVEACRHQLATVGPLALWAAEGDWPTPPLSRPAVPGGRDARASTDAERRQEALRGLPVGFRRRLALASLVAASRGGERVEPWQDPGLAAVVTALLAPVLRQALTQAGGPGDAAAALDIRVTAVPDGDPVAVAGEARPRGGWARLRLQPSWAAWVWAHGRAEEDGAVLLRARGRAGRERRLLARWEPVGDRRWQLRATVAPGVG